MEEESGSAGDEQKGEHDHAEKGRHEPAQRPAAVATAEVVLGMGGQNEGLCR